MSSAPSPKPGPAPSRAGREAGAAGERVLFPLACRWLPPEVADNFRILGAYAAALRAVADHPALEPARKEERLKALAGVLQGESASEGIDPGLRAALNLRHLLESRGLDVQDPWQMLQAAGLDVTKSRYPDWSDLLAWCRYWAAPVGRMAYRLAGGAGPGLERAESFAIGAEILYLVEQAPAHQRWLGRVYLPERWFREAECDPAELSAARSSPGLKRVFARAAGEALRLVEHGAAARGDFPGRRLRIAAATAEAEVRAWARRLVRGDPLAGPLRPGSGAEFAIRIAGLARGFLG